MKDEKTILHSEAANDEPQVQDEENIKNIINRKLIWKSPKFIIAVAVCIIVVIVTITAIALSASSDNNDIVKKLETARKYLTEMKYEEAKALFEEVIEADPKCEEAYIGLADVYIGLGDEDKAMAVLKQGIDNVGETSDLKKKLKELEDKQNEDNDNDKETEPEEDTTVEVTTEAATEPEGDTTAEDNESTDEQNMTLAEEAATTTGEQETTTKQQASQQQTTTQKQTTTQQRTTTQKQTTTQQQTTTKQQETTTEVAVQGVKWKLEGDTLTIYGNGAMNLTNVSWYSEREKIKTVVIEGGITSIGEGAFYECSSLQV